MTRKDREKLNQCFESRCRYYDIDCLIHHGAQCKRLGGDKIPRMRHHGLDKPRGRAIRNSAPVSSFKPYFMSPCGSESESAYDS